MTTSKKLLVIVFIVLLNSCATNIKFPISTVVPAASISAQKKSDKEKNFTLEITSKNLASSDRLVPPGNNYSVWIITKDKLTKNVGRLITENGKSNTFKTVTPFDFNEIFITVEKEGDLSYPQGREITRAKF